MTTYPILNSNTLEGTYSFDNPVPNLDGTRDDQVLINFCSAIEGADRHDTPFPNQGTQVLTSFFIALEGKQSLGAPLPILDSTQNDGKYNF